MHYEKPTDCTSTFQTLTAENSVPSRSQDAVLRPSESRLYRKKEIKFFCQDFILCLLEAALVAVWSNQLVASVSVCLDERKMTFDPDICHGGLS